MAKVIQELLAPMWRSRAPRFSPRPQVPLAWQAKVSGWSQVF